MAEFSFPQLKIDKTKSNDDIKLLLMKIKPQWTETDIQIQTITGGYSSNMFLCFAKTATEDKLIVKISSSENDQLKQKQFEIMTLEYMSSIGHFPKLYAKYQNGYCYQYIKGKPIVDTLRQNGTITTEHLWHVAKEMAFIHSIKVDTVKYDTETNFHKKRLYMENAKWTIDHPLAPTKISVLKELELVEKYLATLGSPIVHCHGDPHCGNIIWNANEMKVTFVDWEGTYVGYQYQDVAHHLITFWICEITNFTKKGWISMPENIDGIFVKFYYDCQREMNNENFKVESLTKFEELVTKFKLPTLLLLIAYCLIESACVNDWSGNRNFFLERCINDYLKIKQKFLFKGEFEK